ncbi:MAG: InlB B-repeat-containing protein, partial [Clostridia bacterium]|nr:InlB B-repeat-containing protein [Clostridia bacterium]
ITYVLSGGDNNSKNPRKYTVTTPTIKLKKPTLKGYTFRGWYFDRYYNNEVSEIPKGSAGDLTLYARWENNDYKIIMDVKK